MVEQARNDLRELVGGEQWRAAAPYYQLVWHAIEADEVDMAAADLEHWFSISSANRVEEDSGDRHNCRNVIESALRFLDYVQPLGHARAANIRDACLLLSAGAYTALSPDAQARVRALQLSRDQ